MISLPPIPISLVQLLFGILGGFLSGLLMYGVRQKQKRDGLRTALATEINITPKGQLETAFRDVHSLKTPVADKNLNKLHLLSHPEIASVIRYHEQMEKVRRYNDRNGNEDEVNISRNLLEETVDVTNNASKTLAVRIGYNPLPRLHVWWANKKEDDEPEINPEEQKQKLLEAAEEHYNEREN